MGSILIAGNRKIHMSSYDNSRDRTERLNRILGFVTARNDKLIWELSGIHDHKGQLEVYSKRPLQEDEKNHFRLAWGNTISCEVSNNVDFYVGVTPYA